jgi:aminopeptidase N
MCSSRKCRARWFAACLIAPLLAGVAAPAQARERMEHPARSCVAGAPGLGDPYYPTYGNGGYDVRHYDLDLAYDPGTDVLDGRASISARATQRLCSFDLDLVGLEVHAVRVNGRWADWSRSGQELVITPRRPLRDGRRFDVKVRYSGVPVEFELFPGSELRMGFMTTPEGATVAGEPEGAAGWYPVDDHPLDKASYTFDVTVPDGYEVVANGLPRGRFGHDGRTTWRWVARDPMASYLATIDIARWDVHRWRTDTGIPVLDAVDSGITGALRAAIDGSLSRQGEILGFLGGAFGAYPFEAAGAIVPNQDDLVFALETQTRPVYSKLFWLDAEGNPAPNDFVVVHELAHQWFGDDVAVARWQDIWLNEGFATYAEWLWAEHEGLATPHEILLQAYESIPPEDPFWSVVIGDPGVPLLFDGAVYLRGAMTLQVLREEVGDDAFWAIMREWAAGRSGGNGTIPEFIALAERLSRSDLDQLFDAWLFTPGRPALPAAASTTSASAPAGARAGAAEWLQGLERRLAMRR